MNRTLERAAHHAAGRAAVALPFGMAVKTVSIVAILVAASCGQGAAPPSAPGECREGRSQACLAAGGHRGTKWCGRDNMFGDCVPDPYPSAPPETNVAAMRWLGTVAEGHRRALNAACDPAVSCQDFRAADSRGVRPEQARACLEQRLPACERAVEAVRRAEGPEEVLPFLRAFGGERAGELCQLTRSLARGPRPGPAAAVQSVGALVGVAQGVGRKESTPACGSPLHVANVGLLRGAIPRTDRPNLVGSQHLAPASLLVPPAWLLHSRTRRAAPPGRCRTGPTGPHLPVGWLSRRDRSRAPR